MSGAASGTGQRKARGATRRSREGLSKAGSKFCGEIIAHGESRPVARGKFRSWQPRLAETCIMGLRWWACVVATLGALVTASAQQERAEYTFWSSDFHISPIHDLKEVLRGLGQRVLDKSLSGHCHLTKTCAGRDLKVLTKQNGINLGTCPNRLRRAFYEAYKSDAVMRGVDAFVCQRAAASPKPSLKKRRNDALAGTRRGSARPSCPLGGRSSSSRARATRSAATTRSGQSFLPPPREMRVIATTCVRGRQVEGVEREPRAHREEPAERRRGEQFIRREIHRVLHGPRGRAGQVWFNISSTWGALEAPPQRKASTPWVRPER